MRGPRRSLAEWFDWIAAYNEDRVRRLEEAYLEMMTGDPRTRAISAATEESQSAHERAHAREQAAWITGSPHHRREADRARAWAEFHALVCRGRR